MDITKVNIVQKFIVGQGHKDYAQFGSGPVVVEFFFYQSIDIVVMIV